jgi:hypothetical protein
MKQAATVIIAIIGIPLAILASAFDYVPGRQTYWDYKINKMCESDGGLTVLHHIPLSKADIAKGVLPLTWSSGEIGKGKPNIGVTLESLSHKDAPAYVSEEIRTTLREWNPSVWRVEQVIVRRSDRAIVGRMIYYTRSGGDFPSFAHTSSRICPNEMDKSNLFFIQ